jgi:hypothetical protein
MTDKETQQVEQYIKPYAVVPVDMETTGLLVNALRAALAQPEREWQGLTEDEVMVLNRQSYDAQIGLLPLTFYRAIEQALKEKNK